jgi:FkbM family methyltransferase
MKIYDCKLGRLGNAIFRYFASTLFRILYGAERTYNQDECNQMISDNDFINWFNLVLNNNIPNIDNNKNFMFYGYYQHDIIYNKYKDEIIKWIYTHPDELLWTDGNDNNINYFNYKSISYKNIQLLINPYAPKLYNVVVHLRLEDFIKNSYVIHPESIKQILDKINEKSVCLVVNKPTTELENKYLEYFKKFYDITIESNSVIEDYHIMKNAKILVCSCSTLSWIAAFLSNRITTVYFPDYLNKHDHETFKNPIENTILYKFTQCSQQDLENFLLSNKQVIQPNITTKLDPYCAVNSKKELVNKLDPYCAVNCKREPITKRILEYIGNIENGFYIEAGAYDGILQSNTKFLEEELNWTGILIEPSPKVFLDLEKNRPNNININKCLVSSKYSFQTISGSFDNGPMSSVGNMRYIENAELIDVPCESLYKILDYLEIPKIDFMTVDTEGYELDVLDGLKLEKYRPTYLLVEIYETSKIATINYITEFNYILLENITNYNKLDNPGWDGTHNDYLFKSM